MNLENMTGEQRLRNVHVIVTRLGLSLPSAVGEALARLDRVRDLHTAEYVGLAQEARHARADAINQLIDGRAKLRDVIDTFAVTAASVEGTHAVDKGAPLALAVLDYAARAAMGRCDFALAANAGPIFDTVAKAARESIARIASLPEPPAGIFLHPEPTQLLARTVGHEATLSVLVREGDRFEQCWNAALYVRDTAGYGAERLQDGAPRDALTYRRWQRYRDLNESNLVSTKPEFRLWRCVVEGCEPGIWKPEQVAALTAEELSPQGRLRNNGSAVF
ncbi:hypothetical protein FNH05_27570 [Amycolatopsis rhizosphaerae]|uniref:Uncharacterized protein n=1 Tax=Amycolatopsis rhizosphaerae TaxID=2053003 RepID=A0A558B8C0_9PSEU|nr:hypothetical protein [Amycolatopsis rhizosphaerae]TVT32747.1 hypothetical protein FNH05_27570 [Amycolatopsis rhizosphaerae]